MAETVSDPITALPALPLDSFDWVPLDIPHRWLAERIGNPDLAAHDLATALAKRVRSMRRYFGRFRDLSRPDLEREQLEFSFWVEHRLTSWTHGLRIGLANRGVDYPIPAVGVYAWKPDLELVWPDMFASAPAKEAVSVAASIPASTAGSGDDTTPRSVLRQTPGPKTARDWQDHVLREAYRAAAEGRRLPSGSELADSCAEYLGVTVDVGDINKFLKKVREKR
jgi:hypothetical protein